MVGNRSMFFGQAFRALFILKYCSRTCQLCERPTDKASGAGRLDAIDAGSISELRIQAKWRDCNPSSAWDYRPKLRCR
jgi:hypothetical protein